ncbi:rluC [Symbiodinium sp. CCMP2592]|nr:rluC [Symbiodinium sp. CCMP2592]
MMVPSLMPILLLAALSVACAHRVERVEQNVNASAESSLRAGDTCHCFDDGVFNNRCCGTGLICNYGKCEIALDGGCQKSLLGGSGCAEKIYGRSVGCVSGRCCVHSIPEKLLKRVKSESHGVDVLKYSRVMQNLSSGDCKMLMAKTSFCHRQLTSWLAARHHICKVYRAVVHGRPGDLRSDMVEATAAGDWSFQLRMPLGGRDCLTLGREVENLGSWTVLELSPVTGRRHQLRIHMAMIGCPIVGDAEHGRRGDGSWGLLLASVALKLPHPKASSETPEILEFAESEPPSFLRWRADAAALHTPPPSQEAAGCFAGVFRTVPTALCGGCRGWSQSTGCLANSSCVLSRTSLLWIARS